MPLGDTRASALALSRGTRPVTITNRFRTGIFRWVVAQYRLHHR